MSASGLFKEVLENSIVGESEEGVDMDNSTNTIDFLKDQLERINYWLSFAEAKNGAVMAINIALMTIVVDLFSYSPCLCALILCSLTVSSIICIVSFWPNLKTHADNKGKSIDCDQLNLLFYSDIAKLTEEKYKKEIKTKYKDIFANCNSDNKLVEDYLSEIHINSTIANRKYCFFTLAMKVDILSLVLCIFMFIIA